MVKAVHVFLVVVLFILFLFFINKKSEKFDTYYQHDAGASEILDLTLDNDLSSTLKYNWSKRDKFGNNIYDHVYAGETFTRNFPTVFPTDYDTKFTTLDSYSITNESARKMLEPQTYTRFNGQNIFLQQKNTW